MHLASKRSEACALHTVQGTPRAGLNWTNRGDTPFLPRPACRWARQAPILAGLMESDAPRERRPSGRFPSLACSLAARLWQLLLGIGAIIPTRLVHRVDRVTVQTCNQGLWLRFLFRFEDQEEQPGRPPPIVPQIHPQSGASRPYQGQNQQVRGRGASAHMNLASMAEEHP